MIRGNGLGFRYGLSLPWILRGVNVTLNQGEVVALVGANGSGKTTLARILAGELIPQEGVIVREQSAAVAVRYQAFDKNLLPWYSARRNVALIRSKGHEELEQWASAADYNSWAAKRVTALSGGQRQILSVLLVLMLGAALTVLDEPFGAIDPARVPRFWELLRSWSQERSVAVLVITHSLDEALATADRIVVIRDLSKGLLKWFEVEDVSNRAGFIGTKGAQELRTRLTKAIYEIA